MYNSLSYISLNKNTNVRLFSNFIILILYIHIIFYYLKILNVILFVKGFEHQTQRIKRKKIKISKPPQDPCENSIYNS